MHVLAVGELYDPPRTRFENREAVRLGRNIQELVRFWPDPDPVERAAHRAGPAEFALIDESPHLLVLAYRFGDLPWCDSPFQIHRHRDEDRAWPVGGPDGQIPMRTVLVDASSGVVVSLRIDALSLAFSNAVRVAVAEQLLHEPNDDEAQRRLGALYDKHPSSEVMAREVATLTCSTKGPTLGGPRDLTINYY